MRSTSERSCSRRRWSLLPAVLTLLASSARSQEEGLDPESREEVAFMLRRGDSAEAAELLDEVLEETPGDAPVRALRARARFDACDYDGALEDARRALEDARGGGWGAEERAGCARTWLALTTALGRVQEGLALDPARDLRPGADPRDAWELGRALLERGSREEAMARFGEGARAGGETWDAALARARCERALGLFERAARTLVRADELATTGGFASSEPDVLVELGDVYFEAYGEVDDPVSLSHSPAEQAREALQLHPEHEGARLLLFRLHRWNWQRSSQSPGEILEAVFAARPGSLEGLLAQASSALDDGRLPIARQALRRLEDLAPGRRDVRIEQAALAWIEHDRDEARALLDGLLADDPEDPQPELRVGWHLLELYRFGEGLGFLEQAVERDPRDWMAWIQLGRARANTGDEDGAREALARSVEVGEGRRNAWRDNTALVLKRMKETMVLEDHGELRFLWRPDEGEILGRYLPDFYGSAREELAARYGHTPGTTQIEVFRRWEDFSVRSTGFQGFPALGVCFGPVVTAVSPLCELRGTFSWARTSFHEFTHVIHLGLSNNRCPRWVTEGLATWEEGERKHSWWRNMRRDLLDARANGEIMPVRQLNGAFRGPRVLFAYYQSGLLCQMLVERSGFPPMVRLLEAFDEGADLDQAFQRVFQRTPEQIDDEFRAFVDAKLDGLSIEPRWSRASTFRLRFGLARTPPEDAARARAWADDWCKVAWGSYMQRQQVDAQEALRLAGLVGALPARGEFLRGELALAVGDGDDAVEAYRRGFERGGEDYRARMALGTLLARRGDVAAALVEFEAAEKAFPGFPDGHFSAELEQARLHEEAGREERAMEARLRWLHWNSGDYPVRLQVAEWLASEGRHEEAETLFEEANQVDPFRRHLHLAWGRTLAALGRHEEALREFEVGLLVPAELDGDLLQGGSEGLTREEVLELAGVTEEEWELLDDAERRRRIQEGLDGAASDGRPPRAGSLEARYHDEEPLLHGHAALSALALERVEQARASVEAALGLDPDCEPALEARKRLP